MYGHLVSLSIMEQDSRLEIRISKKLKDKLGKCFKPGELSDHLRKHLAQMVRTVKPK